MNNAKCKQFKNSIKWQIKPFTNSITSLKILKEKINLFHYE